MRGDRNLKHLHVAPVNGTDAEALTWARQAQEQLINAEEHAEAVRADFRRALHRLAADGSSPWDIAAALGLSDRQLDEIARAAGGSGRAAAGQAPGTELARTFCARSRRRVCKLITGPGVYFCEACVALAGGVVSAGGAAGTPLGRIHAAPEQDGGVRCRFCAKRRDHVTGMAAMPAEPGDTFDGPAVICAECLLLCVTRSLRRSWRSSSGARGSGFDQRAGRSLRRPARSAPADRGAGDPDVGTRPDGHNGDGVLTTVSARRRMGCCHACCGLTSATTMTTAVVIAAVAASPGGLSAWLPGRSHRLAPPMASRWDQPKATAGSSGQAGIPGPQAREGVSR